MILTQIGGIQAVKIFGFTRKYCKWKIRSGNFPNLLPEFLHYIQFGKIVLSLKSIGHYTIILYSPNVLIHTQLKEESVNENFHSYLSAWLWLDAVRTIDNISTLALGRDKICRQRNAHRIM